MARERPLDWSELRIRPAASGILLPVHAQPGTRRNGVTGLHDGRLKVAVTQAAEKGKANVEIVRLLAGVLDVSRSDLELVRGATAPHKEFLVHGVTESEVVERLQRQFDPPP
ncbi:MAG: DUF167 domain-containing protein [Planctomycetaceae bacterium]|nr:DUF167 domain-containing protein [Planctomycetaceae bacterium]